MKTVTARDEVAKNLARFAVVVKSNCRVCRIKVMHTHTVDLEPDLATLFATRFNQIFHNLLLRVDRDAAPRQLLEIDAMTTPVEAQLDSIVDKAFPLHSLPYAHFREQINCALFQDSGSHPLFAVFPASSLDDDRLNALQMQQVR